MTLNPGPEERGENIWILTFYYEGFDVGVIICFNWFSRVVGFWTKL